MTERLEVAQIYASLRVDAAKAVGELDAFRRRLGGIKDAVFNVKNVLAGLVAGYGLKSLASSFLEAARQVEDYQTSLRAVIKDTAEADDTFNRIREWAAINPINTDDAVAGFVRLKTAAITNSEEALKVVADTATVMHRSVVDVASAVVTGEAEQLRQLGINLVRTGKEAVIQSGQVKIAVSNDIESIRRGILEVMGRQFAGAMKAAGDTFSGMMNTIGGLWTDFKQRLMGDSGTGGPFDAIKQQIREIRDEWSTWIGTEDYERFIADIQGAMVSAIRDLADALKWARAHAEELKTTLWALIAINVVGWLNGIRVSLAALSSAGTVFGGLSVAATEFAQTIRWVLVPALASLMAYDVFFKKGSYHTSPVGGPNSSRSDSPTRGELEKMRREQVSQMDKLDSLRTRNLQQRGSIGTPTAPNLGAWPKGGGGKDKGKKTYDQVVAEEMDLWKARLDAGKIGEDRYLALLGRFAADEKLKESSRLKYLKEAQEIRADVNRKNLEEVEKQEKARQDSAKRGMEMVRLQAESEARIREAAANDEIERERSRIQWLESLGMMSVPRRLQMESDLADQERTVRQQAANEKLTMARDQYSAEMRELGSTHVNLQAAEIEHTETMLQIDRDFHTKKTEIDRQAYEDQNHLQIRAQNLMQDAEQAVADLSLEFGVGLANALASAASGMGSLGDALQKLGADIAYTIIRATLLKTILGALGFGSSGGVEPALAGAWKSARGNVVSHGSPVLAFAGGGVVSAPTFFPMKGGRTGLMGEAGPEAIMPLRRGPDGKLGVQSSGGGDTMVHVTIQALDSKSFADMARSNRLVFESMVVENVMRNGAIRKAMKGAG